MGTFRYVYVYVALFEDVWMCSNVCMSVRVRASRRLCTNLHSPTHELASIFLYIHTNLDPLLDVVCKLGRRDNGGGILGAHHLLRMTQHLRGHALQCDANLYVGGAEAGKTEGEGSVCACTCV